MEPSGSRPSAPIVKPLEANGVRYEAAWDKTGVLTAFDVTTSKALWKLNVYDYYHNPEAPAHFATYIKSIEFEDEKQTIVVEDEVGRKYSVSLKDKKVSPINKPVKATLIGFSPTDSGWEYQVELIITNDYNRVLKLDGVSVAEDGKLSNDLFRVKANGKEIPYRGMMGKRSAPDTFIKLKPGAEHKVIINMGPYYPLPPGPIKLSVQFSSENHFSPDNFLMESTPDARELAGTWKRGPAIPPPPPGGSSKSKNK